MTSSLEKPEHIHEIVDEVSGITVPVPPSKCLVCAWEAGKAAERNRLVEEMAKMKMIAMNQGQFQAGWDSALEEIFTRMGLEEDHGR